ncbi:hypothetical protein AAHZ94_17550 [Streptomyces sp. HSW2009]|uniref:hypothetical protein n=1 Tax=Streptomyces sp. HSW2009 TaxID=3142890 RepID=UPI0032EB11BA
MADGTGGVCVTGTAGTQDERRGTPAAAARGGATAAGGAWRAADRVELGTGLRHELTAIAAVLAGIDRALPGAPWHLKGSSALLGWAGPTARPPADVDLALPAGPGAALLRAAELPPGPGGERLRLLRTEPVVFSRPGRVAVHRVLVRVMSGVGGVGEVGGMGGVRPAGGAGGMGGAGAVDGAGAPPGIQVGALTDDVLLNIVLVPDDIAARDTRTAPLAFPAAPGPCVVPAATFGRCLAQKLLRYARLRDGGKINTRWSDVADFLIAAASPRAPLLELTGLRQDVAAECAALHRPWPAELPPPPAEWLDFWDTATFQYGWPFGRLSEAVARVERFWGPVLAVPVAPYGTEGAAPYGPECAARADAAGAADAAGGDAGGAPVRQIWSPTAWEWQPE